MCNMSSKFALVPVVPWANEPPRNAQPPRDPWAEEKNRTLGLLNSIQAVATERLLDKFSPDQWCDLTPMEQLAYIKLASDLTGSARRMRQQDETLAPVGASPREQHLGNQLRALAGKLSLPELRVVDNTETARVRNRRDDD